jgi:hypothetical protein
MTAARIIYRTRQFWHGLRLTPTAGEIDRVRRLLNPAQFDLFFRLQPGEQSHSLAVFNNLSGAGEGNPDLLVAALLHDAGKSLYPLKLWERVWIVLGKAFFPQRSEEWASGNLEDLHDLPFWKRPFVVADQHPQWGANLAAQACSSSLVVSLIRRHQETLAMDENVTMQDRSSASDQDGSELRRLEDCLLQRLQAADEVC